MISETYDPVSVLTCPPPVDSGNYEQELQKAAGFVIGSVDKYAAKFFGISLLEQAVKPLAGDWTKLEYAARGYDRIALALEATAENLKDGASQIGTVWTGEAAGNAERKVADFAEHHRLQSEGCKTLAEQLRHVVEVSKAAAETLMTGLSVISELLLQMAAEAAAVVVGWVVGAATAGYKAFKFWSWLNKILTAIRRVVMVIQLVQKAVEVVQKMIGQATTIGHTLGGTYMDNTSRVQFGVG